jgi:hypothetical protein
MGGIAWRWWTCWIGFQEHPQRVKLGEALQRSMEAVVAVQDNETGLWWQVMDRGPTQKAKLTDKGVEGHSGQGRKRQLSGGLG